MKTPTHMLIGYFIGRVLPGKAAGRCRWVVLGAAMPDVPLVLVALWCWLLMMICAEPALRVSIFVWLMDGFYYRNTGFIGLHHLLHAPGALGLLTSAWYLFGRSEGRQDPRGYWFLAGAASHALVDLFTHSSDGILLFWPWDWSYRYDSGVDQWDMSGSGLLLLSIEASLFVAYGTYRAWAELRPLYLFLRL